MNKFDEVLKVRREEVRQQKYRSLQMQRQRIKKEKRKDVIIFIVLVICFILSLALAMKLGQSFTSDCVNSGNTQQYCEKGL